jgi:hypothetical protein
LINDLAASMDFDMGDEPEKV